MKLPDSVLILGYRYALTEVEDLKDEKGEGLYGHVSNQDMTMRIEKKVHPDKKIQIIIHESLHAILHLTGHYMPDSEERLVQMLGCTLPVFFRDNPAIFAMMAAPEISEDFQAKLKLPDYIENFIGDHK